MTFSHSKLSFLLLLLAAFAVTTGCDQCCQHGGDSGTNCESGSEDEAVVASVDYSMASPGDVTEIKNEMEFANFIKNNQIAVVKFGAEWCGPCKALDPEFDKMAGYFQVPGLAFARVDVDQLGKVASDYGVSGIPNTFIFIGGKSYTHVVGNIPELLANAINSVCQDTVSVEEAQSELQKNERLEDELWSDEATSEPEIEAEAGSDATDAATTSDEEGDATRE